MNKDLGKQYDISILTSDKEKKQKCGLNDEYEKFKEIEFDLMSPCHKFGGITRIHKNGPALLSSHVHAFRLDNEVVLKELPAKFFNRFYCVILCGAFTDKEIIEALQSYIVDPKNLRKLYNIYKNYGNKFFDHLQLTKLEDDNYYRYVIFGITETIDEASDGRKKWSKKKKIAKGKKVI